MDFTDVRFENFDLENQKLQDYDVSANEFQLKNQNRSSVINMGLKLTFERYWRPFALKYHAPCAIIVIVCHISYFVPPNIAPARIGLLVTNFLALSNIFTSHQVLKIWINIILMASGTILSMLLGRNSRFKEDNCTCYVHSGMSNVCLSCANGLRFHSLPHAYGDQKSGQ